MCVLLAQRPRHNTPSHPPYAKVEIVARTILWTKRLAVAADETAQTPTLDLWPMPQANVPVIIKSN